MSFAEISMVEAEKQTTKVITLSEYSQTENIPLVDLVGKIKSGELLPEVISISKHKFIYQLEVPFDFPVYVPLIQTDEEDEPMPVYELYVSDKKQAKEKAPKVIVEKRISTTVKSMVRIVEKPKPLKIEKNKIIKRHKLAFLQAASKERHRLNEEILAAQKITKPIIVKKHKPSGRPRKFIETPPVPKIDFNKLKAASAKTIIKNKTTQTEQTPVINFSRPKAQYSNTSPYGIAAELHLGQM